MKQGCTTNNNDLTEPLSWLRDWNLLEAQERQLAAGKLPSKERQTCILKKMYEAEQATTSHSSADEALE